MRLVSAYYEDYYPFDALPGIDDMIATSDPSELKKGDILLVWGGADIPPKYYNKGRSSMSGAYGKPSSRDQVEWNMIQAAIRVGIPIIGVCRGGQMLCAAAGGYLIQHVNGHGGYHGVTTREGDIINVNSIHHQMMMPGDKPHILLGHTTNPRSTEYYDVDENGNDVVLAQVDMEREYIYFPEVKGHAIQWHPEGMHLTSPATQYIFEKFKEFQ